MSVESRLKRLEEKTLPKVTIINTTSGSAALFTDDGIVFDMSKCTIEKGKY